MSFWYVDINGKKYSSINNYKNNSFDLVINSKALFRMNPKLVIFDSKFNKKYELTNPQMLYLYPLNILDYIKGAKEKKTIKFYLNEFSSEIDYLDKFKKMDISSLKNVEIKLDKNYSKKELNNIFVLVSYLKKKNIKISYNIDYIYLSDDILLFMSKTGDYFKIFLDNIYKTNKYQIFLEKLSFICNNTNLDNNFIHVKSFLNINEVLYYEEIIDDLKKIGVDVFQVSKELLGVNAKNKKVSSDIQQKIRYLENKYCDNFRFISVKDITLLYYPRFELDSRNTKVCHSCYLKPYIFNNFVLPCKVLEKVNNMDKWKLSCLSMDYNANVIYKCGNLCDDCASIFENDTIENILRIIIESDILLLEGED